MVLLEQYITLYERDSNLVFSAWKGIQIVLYAVAAVTGIVASYCISELTERFGGNCILYGNVTFISDDPANTTLTLPVDNHKTDWGKENDCTFCQYVAVSSVIFSVVWSTFFTMCGRGGKTTHGLSKPWRIVYPALIFNIILFVVAFVAAIRLQQGILFFCTEFVKNNNATACGDISKYALVSGKGGNFTFYYMIVAQIASWTNVFCWLLGVSLLLLRCLCVADFTVMKITVIAPTPSEEQPPKRSTESLQFHVEN